MYNCGIVMEKSQLNQLLDVFLKQNSKIDLKTSHSLCRSSGSRACPIDSCRMFVNSFCISIEWDGRWRMAVGGASGAASHQQQRAS